jgi:acyl-[acyl-carrier-protein]-phospholipid O-acyltransferase/long-chain-fatty-acid--[acyl-carrier-protein] ligase
MDETIESPPRGGRAAFAAMGGAYFLGTFNDNFFKQAVMLIAVGAGRTEIQGIAAMAFLLPFVLFAAPAGWAADRFVKRNVVVSAKATELLGAVVGAAGLLTGNLWLMVGMVGLMGLQSAFFSPALNGGIPELFPRDRVTRVNAVFRLLVTVGILVGTAAAGIVLDIPGAPRLGAAFGRVALACAIVGIGVVGLGVSFGVPRRDAADPTRPFPWRGPADTLRELRDACADRLLGTVIGADVFIWSLGALQLLLINPMGLAQFGLSKQHTGFLVAAQMLGIGLGGMLAARLAKGDRWHRVLAPAAFSMALFLGAVFALPSLPAAWRLPLLYPLLALVGASGGLILIPCESFIQVRPAPARKGAVWASANFAVFLGMAVASGLSNLLNLLLLPTQSFGILAVSALLFALAIGPILGREAKR